MAVRIASLVPSATEMLFALGLGERVVAVTHECDFPAEVKRLPRLTRSLIPPGLVGAEVDAAVRERVGAGESLYALDAELLDELSVDLIVTQQLCAVCAVASDEVRAVAARLPSRPGVVSHDPTTLSEVLDDAVTLAAAAGERGRGVALRERLVARIAAIREATAGAAAHRVATLEWLDPPYCAGHWLPEMIAAAGGRDALSGPGERSRQLDWEEIGAAGPDVVAVMPCGLHADAALEEAKRHRQALFGLGAEHVFALDAAASFSRPGPRLVDGVELLAHLLHPGRVETPPDLKWRELEAPLRS